MAVQLIGSSVAFRRVLDAIPLVAPVDSPVLLLGETGTGKELIARAIHDAGPRRRQPLVAVNCAAIPSGLVESELFGYERGAFTGAATRTIGRFQSADHGTLFLDEIGDLPLEVQPKLLRALQEQQIERLGSGGRPVAVDVRIIAATNQNLWEMVQRRAFRADLYYRLNVFPIVIPPLRHRREDVPLLAAYFVQRFADRHRRQIQQIPEDVLEALTRQPWPGNVRELQNVVERAVIATKGTALEIPSVEGHLTGVEPPSKTLAEVERDHILETLHATSWVVGGWNGAAARLGLPRTTLIARMQRLGLVRESGPHGSLRPGSPRRSAGRPATASCSPRPRAEVPRRPSDPEP